MRLDVAFYGDKVWLKRSDSSQVYAFSYGYDAAGNRIIT